MKKNLAGVALAVTLTACGVSTQQEVDMGQQYSAQINQQLPIVSDPEINRYINVLGDSIARLTSRTDITEANVALLHRRQQGSERVRRAGRLRLRESRPHRAHAADGPARGRAGPRDRPRGAAALHQADAAAAGRERRRDARLRADERLQQPGGPGRDPGGRHRAVRRFSRQDEAEADEEGIRNTVRAGISPNGMPEMFQILINERTSNPVRRGGLVRHASARGGSHRGHARR